MRPRPVCCHVEFPAVSSFRMAVVGLVMVCACSSTTGEAANAVTPETSATSTTSATTTPTTEPENRIGIDLIRGLPIEIFGPEEVGEYPVVVMHHGGGWFGGSAASMEPLAGHLASHDIVV